MPRDRKRPRPPPRVQLVPPQQFEDWEAAQRAVNDVTDAVSQSAPITERNVLIVNLIVGDNRLNHGLSGRARGANVCPTVASSGFAWSFRVDNDLQVIITVLNDAQPRAAVEVYR